MTVLVVANYVEGVKLYTKCEAVWDRSKTHADSKRQRDDKGERCSLRRISLLSWIGRYLSEGFGVLHTMVFLTRQGVLNGVSGVLSMCLCFLPSVSWSDLPVAYFTDIFSKHQLLDLLIKVFYSINLEKAMAPTPVLLPGKSHGWRSLVGCSPWGR